jgi:hypothetical protein
MMSVSQYIHQCQDQKKPKFQDQKKPKGFPKGHPLKIFNPLQKNSRQQTSSRLFRNCTKERAHPFV